MAGRTLHVRCASWDQVETFTTRKLRHGKLLSMKVPFVAKLAMPLTLGLELPNGVIVAIDGVVHRVSPVESGGVAEPNRSWIEIELVGFTAEVKARLTAAAAHEDEPTTDPQIQPAAPLRRPTITPLPEEMPADERTLFQQLSAELRRLRQAAVHEVLGVAPGASPDQVRSGWKELIRRHHPDLMARRHAPALTHLAEELTILANRAYDRMRARLVADGRGVIAGPAVAQPPGWLLGFDDISSGSDGKPLPGGARHERPPTPVPLAASPASATGQGSDAYEQRARAMLGAGDAHAAREVLAAALVVYPRSKPVRSLYYVATALAALQDGEIMLATSQLETALAHHDQCVEATKLLDHIRKHGAQKPDEMRRYFR
jgi:hypothetical protein